MLIISIINKNILLEKNKNNQIAAYESVVKDLGDSVVLKNITSDLCRFSWNKNNLIYKR